MRRKLLIVALAAICLVFASGVGVGVVGHKVIEPKVKFRSLLVEELDLTPDQRQKIEQIWNKVAEKVSPPSMAQIEKADAERRADIDRLLTADQRARYAQIQQRFDARMEELDGGNRARVAQAEEQTKQLLTLAQREKYEQLLARPRQHVFYLKTATRP